MCFLGYSFDAKNRAERQNQVAQSQVSNEMADRIAKVESESYDDKCQTKQSIPVGKRSKPNQVTRGKPEHDCSKTREDGRKP
jgi:hypothetical protein